ncbi:hypothetical protein [Yersinia mollaretii]|uniref:Uncharacterized protein n=1 Tax=Yersinia mollaretii TaxID=33060 RepID=A0AA36LJ80_YERMO|nr:hypothetical protein [Yersinia mollaretii]MDA5525624.1 hypothetical protein [Yersinia mollaretii]MDR7871725.1 hypothetical protein [Yersinia mollaretii]WQC73725.1 hypothetical protein U1Z61_14900 [Yersinia mollaretii]CNE05900.1 Uncharacterised protein [Yersinia mollaretii]CNH51599.1 Uncharacterised protein [Yersinia mollaretii]
MFKKITFFLMLLLYPFILFAQEDIVQGPFKIDDGISVYIKKENDINYPLGFYFQKNNESYKIDSYETDGDIPNIETVFLIKLNKMKNIIVLVSWHQEHRAEKISGDSYQVYGYTYKNNYLTPNKAITNDPNLSGQNGDFNGEELHFKYQNSASIIKYLKDKFN